jgi:hypothetical protein
VISGVRPEVWVICGERNPTAPDESLYMYLIPLRIPFFSRTDNGLFERIKKKVPGPVSVSPSWILASSTPGTQVFVQTGLQLGGV